jgi:hypothetical protein
MEPRLNSALRAPKKDYPHSSWRDSFYSLCFEDSSARWTADLIVVAMGLSYAVFQGSVIGAPEKQVVGGMALIMLATKLAHAVWYCYRHSAPPQRMRLPPSRYWSLLLRYSIPVFIISTGLVFLPGAAKNRFTVAVLSQTDIGLLPGTVSAGSLPLSTRFNSQTKVIQNLIAENKPGNPTEIHAVRSRLENVVQSVTLPDSVKGDAINEIAHLNAYEKYSRVVNPGGSPRGTGRSVNNQSLDNDPRPPIISSADPIFRLGGPSDFSNVLIRSTLANRGLAFELSSPNASLLLRNVVLVNVTQKLDRIEFVDTTFLDSTIIYEGGPLRLRNVKFVDCQFQIDPENDRIRKFLEENGASGVTVF